MKINNELLQQLMIEVDQSVDKLLIQLINQKKEIDKLKNENKQFKDQYAQILKQISAYVAELEGIKHSNM